MGNLRSPIRVLWVDDECSRITSYAANNWGINHGSNCMSLYEQNNRDFSMKKLIRILIVFGMVGM